LNVQMDGASLMDSGMEFQMTNEWQKCADRLWDWHKAQLREVDCYFGVINDDDDYWITVSEKVHMVDIVSRSHCSTQRYRHDTVICLSVTLCIVAKW